MGTVFFIISAVDILGAIFSEIFIPETRNKTVSQLEKIFAKDQKNQPEAHDAYDNPLQVFE